MPPLDEQNVVSSLSNYFRKRGLNPLGKVSPFSHIDDSFERTFEIDLAIGPTASPGIRTQEQVSQDKSTFIAAATNIDRIVDELRQHSIFPKDQCSIESWRWEANPNPVFGLAIEIENNFSKYLLGSLLASAICGRWGFLILPESPEVPRWIETLKRMMHKGAQSPIPSNVAIFLWPSLRDHLNRSEFPVNPNA